MARATLPPVLAAAIDERMARIRAALKPGATRDTLKIVQGILAELAPLADHFDRRAFPLGGPNNDGIYLLSEDPGRELALYLGARLGAIATPPHNHTTWAVIVGLHGKEHNRFFDRTPNGVRQTGAFTVERGTGVAMLDDDLHAIHTDAGELNMQLHLYGRSFDAQGARVMIDPATGAEKIFAGHPEVQIPTGRITPAMLRRMIEDGGELALLDVREPWLHNDRGHPLVAANLPLDRIELDAARRIPNRGARIVLLDDDGLAAQAEARLRLLDYDNIHVLPGGVAAWAAAGYEVFTGINVPSKAFGEHVEATHQTPQMTAGDLKARMDDGRPLVLLDCRTPGEHVRMTLPGAVNVPGTELVAWARDLAPDPKTPVVVHCAGRTRGIMGAQTLLAAGLPNPVYAVRNGMIGWLLAGFALDYKAERRPDGRPTAPLPGPADAAPEVDAATLDNWLSQPDRTTYVFDVRTAAEYAKGHHPAARLAPGGELLQQLDLFATVRRARIVIAGGDGRARMAAFWLRRMDWGDVFLLRPGYRELIGDAAAPPALPRGWKPPFDETEQDPQRMRAYIDWEHGLLAQLERDGTVRFA